MASVFVTSLFALGGSEFIALAASETANPRSSIRAASKMVYFKVIVLFLGSLALVGLLVSRENPRLMGSGGGGSHASPYVLAAELNGIRVLPHIINAVILISVTSVATAAMYSSPRLIQSMAEQGLGPKWLDYIDKKVDQPEHGLFLYWQGYLDLLLLMKNKRLYLLGCCQFLVFHLLFVGYLFVFVTFVLELL